MKRARAQFERFWTAPGSARAAASFRIVYGALAVWQTFALWINAERYFGPRGMLPWSVARELPWSRWSLLALAPESSGLVHALFAVMMLAALALALGLRGRVAAAVLFACNVSIQHRNPFIFSSGDKLFLQLAGLAMCLPLDARWAVLRTRMERVPIWGLRLVQLHLTYIYLYAVTAKLKYPRWREGLALQDVLSSPVYAEWPTRVGDGVAHVLTWGTLAFELLFPLLIWVPRARLWVLLAGVLFHAGIDVAMILPAFSASMIAAYAACLKDDDFERLSELRRAREPEARAS